MGRAPNYTPEEDAIILAHVSADDVNRALRQAGFRARSDSSIKMRRHPLRTQQAAQVDLVGDEGRLVSLLKERKRLEDRKEMALMAVAAIDREMEDVNRELREALEDAQSSLDGV